MISTGLGNAFTTYPGSPTYTLPQSQPPDVYPFSSCQSTGVSIQTRPELQIYRTYLFVRVTGRTERLEPRCDEDADYGIQIERYKEHWRQKNSLKWRHGDNDYTRKRSRLLSTKVPTHPPS